MTDRLRARRYRPCLSGANCVVCLERAATGSGLCDPCGRSLASYESDDGSVASVIRWAAKRARRFERSRQRGGSRRGRGGRE